MSWFNLNYIFGESPGTNTSTFIQRSSERLIVPDSYNGRGNDDHTEEVVSGFRPHDKESLFPYLNEVNIYLFFLYLAVNLPLPFTGWFLFSLSCPANRCC
ncbi:hypothetical protein Hanom_Chr08g00742561 [Helianthus anomalus]